MLEVVFLMGPICTVARSSTKTMATETKHASILFFVLVLMLLVVLQMFVEELEDAFC